MSNKQKTLDQLDDLIDNWAEIRGIYTHGTKAGQLNKTCEEVNGLHDAIHDGDTLGIKDGIGDTFVTLSIQARMNGWTLAECVQYAYDEIKNRKGTMSNGVFVKETGEQLELELYCGELQEGC